MANSGYIKYQNRRLVFQNDATSTGIEEPNTEFLSGGVISDPNYISNVYDIITCPLPVVPSIPINLISSLISQTTFTLNWDASSESPSGYKIYKNGILYEDVGLVLFKNIVAQVAGSSNTWTVSSYNINGESNQSVGLVVTQVQQLYAVLLQDSGETFACSGNSGPGIFYYSNTQILSNGTAIYIDILATNKLNGGDRYWWETTSGQTQWIIADSGIISFGDTCI